MRFFFYRWVRKLTTPSSRLFERRWGYNFYSERSMYNWVVRRKAFLVSRWLGAPISIANRATQVVKKLFCRDWDPLPDPDAARSEEHTSELQSLMRISYAAFCLKQKTNN